MNGASVVDLVGLRAAETPDALALASGADTLTYGELDVRANRVAHYLRSLGVKADVPVGLCLSRSLDLVIGALGILKAGGAYVAMDPTNPPDRLAFMLEDAQAAVLITEASLARVSIATKRLVVFPDAPEIAHQPDRSPSTPIAPDDLAYVIYTSGSTGKPKGVAVPHRGLAHLVSWHNAAFAVTAADRASHVAGLGFDAAVWELWPYLAAGASVHLADEETRNSAELLQEWILASRISVGFVPTPLAEELLTSCRSWPPDTALRILLTGGDRLHHYPPPGLPFELVNNYGPTECTVVATSGIVAPDVSPAILPPIGTPIAHTEIHLLDERRQPVPPGTPGEIYVGGAGVARGYHHRPDLTTERFIPDPFSARPGARLYRTGDLGRLLPDGQIEFLGRIDDQIKIRGYRVEPEEIVSALNRHPGIRTSAVLAREDRPGEKRLVAYVVPQGDADLTAAGLRESLRESLPDYMVPAAFVRLGALPVMPSGKIDRAALPVPTSDNTLQDAPSAEPCTETEQIVADIVGELLNLDAVGLDDNFFMLGGHSLLGAQLIARLREGFGIDLTLRSLFEAPTVAALAAELDRRRAPVVAGSP
jgi:amino acid adenylation domain-containing protein